MMGAETGRTMYSTESNKEYCIALHLVGYTWKNTLTMHGHMNVEVTQSALLFLYVMYLSAAVTDLALQPARTQNFETIKCLKQWRHYLVAVLTQDNTQWTGGGECKYMP
jgi:hypothetical protein